PERLEDAVPERVQRERVDVEGAPAELLGHGDGVRDGVEERDVGRHRVAVGRLDVERLDDAVRGLAEDLVALVEVRVHARRHVAARDARSRLWAGALDSSRSFEASSTWISRGNVRIVAPIPTK